MENHSFLQQALVYLLAGVIAVPIFQRLKLGAVLGYLVAGMAMLRAQKDAMNLAR